MPENPNPNPPVTPPVTSNFSAILDLPNAVDHVAGTTFKGVIGIDGWNNTNAYKLIDVIVTVPEGLVVEQVATSDRLSGGKLEYHYSEDSDKLRIVYFDAVKNSTLNRSTNIHKYAKAHIIATMIIFLVFAEEFIYIRKYNLN